MNIFKIMIMALCAPVCADIQRIDVISLSHHYKYDSLVAALSLAGATIYQTQDPSLLIKLQTTMLNFMTDANSCQPKITDAALAKSLFAIVMGHQENDQQIKELQAILGKHLDPDVLYAGDETTASGEGMTALMWAVDRGHAAMMRKLVDHGANSNKKDANKGWTPLHFAAARGNLNLVNYLLDHGALINAENNDKETPLDLALGNDHRVVVELLKKKGGKSKEVA